MAASGGAGRGGAHDALLGLMKICAKLGVSFFHYLSDRVGIPGGQKVPPLPDLVREAAMV